MTSIGVLGLNPWQFATLFGAVVCALILIWKSETSFITKLVWSFFAIISGKALFYLPLESITKEKFLAAMGAAKFFAPLVLVPLAAMLANKVKWTFCFFLFFVLVGVLDLAGITVYMGLTQDKLIAAIFFPYFFHVYGFWSLLTLLGFLAAPVSKSALVVFLLYAFLWLAKQKNIKAILSLSVFVWAISMLVDPAWLSTFSLTYRFNFAWAEYFDYWVLNANQLTGLGPGSFEWAVQSRANAFSNRWCWAVGDWFQILFEIGKIGVGVAFAYWLYLLWAFRKAGHKFLVLMGLGVGMLIYSPLQFFWVQFLTVLILKGEKLCQNQLVRNKRICSGP